MIEHGLALVTCHPRHGFGRLDRTRYRGINRCGIGLCDVKCDLTRELVGYGKIGVQLLCHVIEIERIDRLERSHKKLLGRNPLSGEPDERGDDYNSLDNLLMSMLRI